MLMFLFGREDYLVFPSLPPFVRPKSRATPMGQPRENARYLTAKLVLHMIL